MDIFSTVTPAEVDEMKAILEALERADPTAVPTMQDLELTDPETGDVYVLYKQEGMAHGFAIRRP